MEALVALVVRRALRRERVYRDRANPLDIPDHQLLSKYRFPRAEIMNIINLLEGPLERATKRGNPIPAHTQVLVALRFYASGSFQNVVGDVVGISQPSASRAINLVTNLLFERAMAENLMPTNAWERAFAMQKFGRHNFPRVIALIDGTHFAIKGQSQEPILYINRKGWPSLNAMIVCDWNMRVIGWQVNYPGSSHDSLVWRNSHLRQRFVNGEFGSGILLGKYFFITKLIHIL